MRVVSHRMLNRNLSRVCGLTTALALVLIHSTFPPDRLPLVPPLRGEIPVNQPPALQLDEVLSHHLPPGAEVGGASLSADGERLVAWQPGSHDLLLFGRGFTAVRKVASPEASGSPVVGAAFLDHEVIRVVHRNGSLSCLSWRESAGHACGVLPVSGIRSVATGAGGWWLVADTETNEGLALYRMSNGPASDPTPIMPLAATTERIFLSAFGSDALVAFRDPPHTVWRIGADGRIVASMQPVGQATDVAADSHPPPNWMGLNAFGLGPGILHVVADVTSDVRLLIVYDCGGQPMSNRIIHAPFGFIAVASDAPVIAALRTLQETELVLYSWRWRIPVTSGC